jgi:hypothetical protein
MKTKLILLSVGLALPLGVISAAETSVLLRGNTGKTAGENITVSGSARAIIKGDGDETRVNADEIVFDRQKNALLCVGDSTVSTGGRVFKAKDITIELGDAVARVFTLNSGTIEVVGDTRDFELRKSGAGFMPLFDERLPQINLGLKKLDQAPNRAPSVTVPAPPRREP